MGLHIWSRLSGTRRCRRPRHALCRYALKPRRNLKTVVPGAHAVIVLDGAGWHGSKALCTPDNITLLPLPPYAPELNPIENVWAYLRANKLAISIFDSYDHIVEKCCDAWNFFAEDEETVQNITSREYAKSVIL